MNKVEFGAEVKSLLFGDVIRVTLSPRDNARQARIYVMPNVNWNVTKYGRQLALVMRALSTTTSTWEGLISASLDDQDHEQDQNHFNTAVKSTQSTKSLFDIFNALPSPHPWYWSNNRAFEDIYDSLSYGNIPRLDLEGSKALHLKTQLKKHQIETIIVMMQREQDPDVVKDPRQQKFVSPLGSEYFVDPRTLKYISSQPDRYDDVRGGILAEDMGTGKTLMCLGLVLATKYFSAELPESHRYNEIYGVRTLMEIAAEAVLKNGVPWKAKQEIEDLPSNLVKQLELGGSYKIEDPRPISRRRLSGDRGFITMYLSSVTLIVVPPNLIYQWEEQIKKHCVLGQKGSLRYLLIDQHQKLPDYSILLEYDLILMSRTQFDREIRSGRDKHGATEFSGMLQSCDCPYIGSSRIRDCHCTKPDEYYQSPLFKIHWKRLIIDEGHSMSATNTNSIIVVSKLKVQSKWVVTGTPSGGLHTRYEDDLKGQDKNSNDDNSSSYHGSKLESDDLQRLKNICTNFLELMPYSVEPNLKWRDLSSEVIENILSKVMIRHQPCDTEQLPLLDRKVVLLKPGYYDKLSLNLFNAALATNAVLSEREGKDYMFDPNQKRQVRTLVNNLRGASFWWTGWKVDDLISMIDNINEFVENKNKNKDDMTTSHDFQLLQESVKYALKALGSSSWLYCSEFDEIGYTVSGLGKKDRDAWMTPMPSASSNSNLIGRTYINYLGIKHRLAILGSRSILEMQKYVSSKAYSGLIDLEQFRQHGIDFNDEAESQSSSRPPSDSIPKTRPPSSRNSSSDEYIPLKCHLANTHITGTTSAKLTYIMNKVLEVYQAEKIIIFFDNTNTGYYLADAMMLLGIDYLLYVGGVPQKTKAEYANTFNTTERFRVFLMDINHSSTGIDLYKASRIIFVNPLWKAPSIEAQAIKRAHRLGQTKPVYVETLVLEGTIEEKIYNRRLEMSDPDFTSRQSIIDDEILQDFLKNIDFLKIEEIYDEEWMTLRSPQTLFGKEKAGEFSDSSDAGIIRLASSTGKKEKTKKQKQKKRMAFNDDSGLASTGEDMVEEPKASEGLIQPATKKRRVTFDIPNEEKYQ